MIRPLLAVGFHASIWVLLLPGLVARVRADAFLPPWRGVPWVLVGAAVLVLGARMVWTAAALLVSRGGSAFAARPGPVLIKDGPYARVRNPMDLGATLMAVGPAVASDVSSMWMVPIAAFFYFAIGRGPMENLYLAEAFGEEYRAYRAAVPMWTPLWG